MGQYIDLQSPDGHSFSCYMASPAEEPRGGIVVGMEMYGVNGYLRSVCDDFSEAGYVAVAPALFDRFSPGITHAYDDQGSAAGKDLSARTDHSHTMTDVSTAAQHLRGLHAGLKVAIMGFCFGGTVTWLAACRESFDAAVAYYGSDMCDYPDEEPNCPVICHVGDLDTAVPPSDVAAFQARRPEPHWYIYKGAPHGFDNATRPARYHDAAAMLARERTLTFLAEHIG
ncbi:MAG: dienelactone hydrolase family protein [Alphaproteobacteria bacterium]